MKDSLKKQLSNIVQAQLSNEQIEELLGFFRQVLNNNMDTEDELFFRDMAFEMTGELKNLALLIIDFRKDIRAKICPEITDLTTKYIPQAADQLEGIIETTETAANKIMDNLEGLQARADATAKMFAALKQGSIEVDGNNGRRLDADTVEALLPVTTSVESTLDYCQNVISDTFVQMSFQDLTGQRIRRIMELVRQMEDKLRDMIVSFGIRLSEHQKNPEISRSELEKVVEERVSELAGPQRDGQGLDQADIDDLLANL